LSFVPQKVSDLCVLNNELYLDGDVLERPGYKACHHIVDWKSEVDFIPCYRHTLAFPMLIKLLLLTKFPFLLLELIHTNNQIKHLRPIKKGENLSVSFNI
jgi:hypothetical protein